MIMFLIHKFRRKIEIRFLSQTLIYFISQNLKIKKYNFLKLRTLTFVYMLNNIL